MAEELKYFVLLAEDILGMFLKARDLNQKTPGIVSTLFPLTLFRNKNNTTNTLQHRILKEAVMKNEENNPIIVAEGSKMQTAVLGGGCFWCLEAVFTQLKGVIKVESGYSGGSKPNPNYEEVCSGKTGHAEVIKIEFDPDRISYELLLRIFFSVHDPTTLDRQGNDRGTQYRSIILYDSPQQEQIVRSVVRDLENSKIYPDVFVTEIKPLTEFYKGENYHQEYFLNNPYQPYCQAVISPKVIKLRNKFTKYLKK